MPAVPPIDETPMPSGHVEISEAAMITVIHEAVLACYGVVELGPRTAKSGLRRRLQRNDPTRGIGIELLDDHLTIELSIVVEYGTPIFTVAQNVMQTVKFQVESVLAKPVDRVNVNVDGLRVSAMSEKNA